MPSNIFDVGVFDNVKQSDGSTKWMQVGTTQATYWTDPVSGSTYTVPVGYNPQNTINSFNETYNLINHNAQGAVIGDAVAFLLASTKLLGYVPGLSYDLQRGFNGQSYGGFVKEFTPIASFDVGVAAATSGYTQDGAELGGGLANIGSAAITKFSQAIGNNVKSINTSGDYYNNPINVPNIDKGTDYYFGQTNHNQPWQVSQSVANDFNNLNIFSDNSLTKSFSSLGLDNFNLTSNSWSSLGSGNTFLDDRTFDFGGSGFTLFSNSDRITLPTFGSFLNTTSGSSFHVNQLFTNSLSSYLEANNRVSPLALDLDGDGIETTSLYGTNVFFDIDNDGFAEKVGWIKPDDGMLAFDANGNGIIDNITELFGDDEMPAFEKLAKFDLNHDGKISAAVANDNYKIVKFQLAA